MGLREARKYIEELHKRQDNPYLWPDYLTGLPDRQGILKKLDSVYPKLGKYAIAFVRIANIHPYILKYGSNHHAEIIQWAAAILKTLSAEVKGGFVGTVGTHDFVLITRASAIEGVLKKANSLFKKKALSYYSDDDRKRGYVLSFRSNDGEAVKVGFMKFVVAVANSPVGIEKMEIIPALSRLCTYAEETGEDRIELTEETLQI